MDQMDWEYFVFEDKEKFNSQYMAIHETLERFQYTELTFLNDLLSFTCYILGEMELILGRRDFSILMNHLPEKYKDILGLIDLMYKKITR